MLQECIKLKYVDIINLVQLYAKKNFIHNILVTKFLTPSIDS